MATTDQMQCFEESMCTLLLRQLLVSWLPDYDAAQHESCATPSSEPASKLRIPPLISFLEGLPDVISPNDLPLGKRLPCGHVVYLRAILACCNLLGDATWTAPYKFGCAEPECKDTLDFPKIPDPGVLDGLAMRLDLIEWSWEMNEPTKPDRDAVRLLRDILSLTGHMGPEPEPEKHAEASQRKASEDSLKQTLVHVEIEALAMALEEDEKSDEIPEPERGTQPYCSYRAPAVPRADLRYPMPSPGQECDCVTPHEYVREARNWALTPAETPLDDESTDDTKSESTKKEKKPKPKKTVRFAAPVVVTQVRYFEPWWCDEYRDSDRYWSTGPNRLSTDPSTSEDDEWEIEMMENPALLAAEIAQAAMRRRGGDQASESDGDSDEEWGEAEIGKAAMRGGGNQASESDGDSYEGWGEEVKKDMEKRLRESLWEEDTDVEDEGGVF